MVNFGFGYEHRFRGLEVARLNRRNELISDLPWPVAPVAEHGQARRQNEQAAK